MYVTRVQIRIVIRISKITNNYNTGIRARQQDYVGNHSLHDLCSTLLVHTTFEKSTEYSDIYDMYTKLTSYLKTSFESQPRCDEHPARIRVYAY